MSYNPFRYFTEGKYRNRPLKSTAPLLLKIRNGDFEYSPYFLEAKDNEQLYEDMYNEFMETSGISDINDRKVEAHQHAKMKRIKAQKLMEVGINEEQLRLRELRKLLEYEFGEDLWERCLEKQRGNGTTEDMYNWYKKETKSNFTKSEMIELMKRNKYGKN